MCCIIWLRDIKYILIWLLSRVLQINLSHTINLYIIFKYKTYLMLLDDCVCSTLITTWSMYKNIKQQKKIIEYKKIIAIRINNKLKFAKIITINWNRYFYNKAKNIIIYETFNTWTPQKISILSYLVLYYILSLWRLDTTKSSKKAYR